MPVRIPGQGRRTVVIWNDSAGSVSRAGQAREALERLPDIEVFEPPTRDDAARRIKDACESGVGRVLAAGGDGTVNAVATVLADWQSVHHSSPEMAVLPLGTGNDLARSLGMPLDPSAALEICLSGTARPIDVMELESGDGSKRVAANMITAGNTGKYLDVLTDELKQRWGALCYLRGAVDVLEDLDVFPVQVAMDDGPTQEFDALNLFMANGRTSGGGMTVSADAALDDGSLSLVVIRDGTGFDLATLTLDYLTSDVRENDLVFHRKCRRVRVSCPRLIPLSTDGDAVKSKQFTVVVRPAAIRAVMGQSE